VGQADPLFRRQARIRFDIAAQLWPPHRLGDNVDGPTEDLVEALAEPRVGRALLSEPPRRRGALSGVSGTAR
jgi:hypothetical protein